MRKSLWLRLLGLISLGLLLILIPYKMYEFYEREAYTQAHSPVIKMPIVRRVRRIGNLTRPHLIYIWHRGREYRLGTSSKHFRITAKLDSMEVNYDAERDIVVRSDENVRGTYPLLGAILLCGLLTVGKGVHDFWVDSRSNE